MVNEKYYLLSDIYMEIASRELSVLLGRKARIFPNNIFQRTNIRFADNQKFYLVTSHLGGISEKEIFIFNEEVYSLILEELKKRDSVRYDKKSKNPDISLYNKATFEIFKKSVSLYSFLTGKNIWLMATQTMDLDTKIGKFQKKELIKSSINFTISYTVIIEGKGCFAIFQQVPKSIYRECIKSIYNPDRMDIVERDFLEIVKQEEIEDFDEEYRSLIWSSDGIGEDDTDPLIEKRILLDKSANTFYDKQEDPYRKNTAADTKINEIYNIISEQRMTKYDEDIVLKNPEDFIIANIFVPEAMKVLMRKIFNLQVSVVPVEIRTLYLRKIKKEPTGILALFSYSGTFVNQVNFIFQAKDLRDLERVNDLSVKELLLKIFEPSADMLSLLTKHRFTIDLLKLGYINFSNIKVNNNELALKIKYQIRIGTWNPIEFSFYMSMSFINSLILAVLDEDRLKEIKANPKNLLLSIMDLNAGIQEIAEKMDQFEDALDIIERPDFDLGDPIDNEESGFESSEPEGFIFDLELLAKQPDKTIEKYMFEILKMESGRLYLRSGFQGISNKTLHKIYKNISRNNKENFQYDLKLYNKIWNDRKNPEILNDAFGDGVFLKKMNEELEEQKRNEILYSRIMLSGILYNLWKSDNLELNPALKNIFDSKNAGDIRKEEFETEQTLNSLNLIENIDKLDSVDVQNIIRWMPRDDLIAILSIAPKAVKEKIFENMTEKSIELVNQDMEFWNRKFDNDDEGLWAKKVKTAASIKKFCEIVLCFIGDDYQIKLWRIWDDIMYLYWKNQFEKVISECKNAILLEKNVQKEIIPYYFYDMIAWTNAIQKKNFGEALNYQKKAASRAKDDFAKAIVTDTLGYIYMKQEKYEDAIAMFKKADVIYPGLKFVKKHLTEAVSLSGYRVEKKGTEK